MRLDKATYMDIVQALDLQALEADEARQAMEARLRALGGLVNKPIRLAMEVK